MHEINIKPCVRFFFGLCQAADLVAKQKEARAAAARINANLKAGPPQDGGPVTKVEDAKIRYAGSNYQNSCSL